MVCLLDNMLLSSSVALQSFLSHYPSQALSNNKLGMVASDPVYSLDFSHLAEINVIVGICFVQLHF